MKSCRNFSQQTTRSTPLDSKLMFWCVSYYLGAFGIVWLPYKTWCKTGWSGAKVRAMKSCRNFSQQTTRSTPLDRNLMFRCISYYLGAFWTFCCVTTLSSKRAKLVQKFVPRSRVGIFHNERTRSTHWTLNSCFGVFRTIWVHLVPFGCLTKLGAKQAEVLQKFVPWSSVGIFYNKPFDPPHWILSSCFGAFRTILCIWDSLLRYNIQFKTGQTGAKVRAMKSCRNFSQQTHPVHPIGPLPHVSGCVVLFGCIWDSLLRYNTQFKTGQTCAKVHATKSRRKFSQWTNPIHPIAL